MKFLHVADLHIGKIVNDFSMLEDQKFILEQIREMAVAHQADGILIAGDVYDRAIPPAEAVALFDSFLTELVKQGIQVFLISGNHDSPERISFGEQLLDKAGVHIAGTLKEELQVVKLPQEYGELQVVLLPFIKPAQAGERTTQEAVRKLLSEYWRGEHAEGWAAAENQKKAAEKQSERKETAKGNCSQQKDDIKRILVTHYFVTDAGREPELSDSETTVHVGGLDNVDASVFEGFDYVALGHIHKPQQIGQHPIWYAGSPLKYSFGEEKQIKHALLVTIEKEGVTEVKELSMRPLREMRRLTGTLQELMESGQLRQEFGQDYIQAVLTDQGELIDPIGTLRCAYPNIMQIIRSETLKEKETESMDPLNRKVLAEKKDTKALFSAFYQEVRGQELSEAGKQIITDLIEEIEA